MTYSEHEWPLWTNKWLKMSVICNYKSYLPMFIIKKNYPPPPLESRTVRTVVSPIPSIVNRIFAIQMLDSYTLIYFLADLASVTCKHDLPWDPGHSIKVRNVNNTKTISWLKCLNCCSNRLQLILDWITSFPIQWIKYFANNIFSHKITFVCCYEKRLITLINC